MESRMNERLKTLEGEELVDYIASTVPYLREYFNKTDKGIMRKDIYDRYLKHVENDVGLLPDKTCTRVCQCGNGDFIIDEAKSEEICTNCGVSETIPGEERDYKDELEMEKNVIYTYERKNHLNEWLAQFQAKESTTVPKDVFVVLEAELKKQKIKKKNEITHSKIKELLKKNGFNKYYDHIPYITTILNGIKPPVMSNALEEKIRIMFYKTQEPFEKHKPKDRKNFLSYPYILYKLCELLSEDEFLDCFPLLKDKEKIFESDRIWKKICTELKWQFIKTAV